MHSSALLALAVSISSALAVSTGFNYGSTHTDGSAKVESDFESEFMTAKNLVGASGFTSARLYTMIQAGTANTPISAIPAAIAQGTSLLLGLWASGGQAGINNEIAALQNALSMYPAFASLVTGISVGSEDLYRISPTGVAAMSGYGAGPAEVASYIAQVRAAIVGTTLAKVPVGHVDTWTAWVNGSNSAVITSSDFLGVDAYPYFQNTEANGIENGAALFQEAYQNTLNVAQGKSVWITETGWPVSGSTSGAAVPSLANAKTYWDQVACKFIGNTNLYWYTLQDADPTTPNPSFGLVGSTLTTTPLFDLSCSAVSSSSAAVATSSAAPATKASSSAAGTTTAPASSLASGGGGLSPSNMNGVSSSQLQFLTSSVASSASVKLTTAAGGIPTTISTAVASSAVASSAASAKASSSTAAAAGVASSSGAASASRVSSVAGVATASASMAATSTKTGPTSTFTGAAALATGSIAGAVGAMVALLAAF